MIFLAKLGFLLRNADLTNSNMLVEVSVALGLGSKLSKETTFLWERAPGGSFFNPPLL